MLNNILVNLADNFPQAPISGANPRLREVIHDVNRLDDESNDFIYANKIKIADYLTISEGKNGHEEIVFDEEANYTAFIMKVINTAIEVIHANEEDKRERTNMEIFTNFN